MSFVPTPISRFFHRMASPPHFYSLTNKLLPWLMTIFILLLGYGLYGGLYLAPTDYQQGDSYRIIYVHVPAAWMSLFIYVVMAMAGAIGLIWRIKLAEIMVISSAPIGASFTFIALVTGALWGFALGHFGGREKIHQVFIEGLQRKRRRRRDTRHHQ